MTQTLYRSDDIRNEVYSKSVDRLQASAAEKLFYLGQLADEAYSAIDGASARYRAAYDNKLAKESRLREVQAQFASIPPVKETYEVNEKTGGRIVVRQRDDAKLEQAQKALDDAMAAADAQNTIREAKSEAWQRARRTFEAISDFVRAAAADRQTFSECPVETDKRALSKPAEALDKQRESIARLRTELRRTEAAPLPSSYAKDKARRQLAEMARLARPNVSELVEANGAISWRKELVQTLGYGDKILTTSTVPVANTLGLLSLLFPDQLAAVVDTEIDAISDDANALKPEDRRKEEARLAADILAAERIEESIICACEAAGIAVERRPDASPLAILGVEIATEENEIAA